MDLKLIKEKDGNAFDKFKRKLLSRSCNEDTFYGIRCEISVYALLLRREISFIQMESPDFQSINDEDIHIECTSSHLIDKTINSEKVFKKIKYSVEDKNKKPYASLNTILYIDLTNLNYSKSIFNYKHLFSDPNFETKISKILSRTKYGALFFKIDSSFKDGNDIVMRNYCYSFPVKDSKDNLKNILSLLCKKKTFDEYKGISSKFP